MVKAIGCLVYYGIYFYYYPGYSQSDSASTMHDAKVIYDALPNHLGDYLKILFGFHSESEADPLYQTYFKYIDKWGRDDTTTEFFLNDNRTPIRVNALIMLFSFGQYPVHALAMLILSFIGQMAFYKTVKRYFHHKELLLAGIIFFTPSVLFWTSGVLKEPISMAILGVFLYCFFKLFMDKNYKLTYVFMLGFTSFIFFFIKPYILILLIIPLITYVIVKRCAVKKVALFYLLSISLSYSGMIVSLNYLFHKNVIRTIITRQNDFINLSKGGVFFLNEKYYLRLDYRDIKQFKVVDEYKKQCRINSHAKLMYWDIYHLKDTIFVNDNQDTSLYRLLSVNSPAGSGISVERLEYSISSFAQMIPQAFVNVAFRPLFIDSHSFLEWIASLENFSFILFCIVCVVYRQKQMSYKPELYLCVSIVILSFILIGLTTTVMGAIVRYKVPFLPFMLMVPLFYLNTDALKQIPFIRRLV